MNTAARDYLMANANADGGWGYAAGAISCVEPTAAAIVALRGDPTASAVHRRAVDWLHADQRPDGGWGIGEGDDLSGWHTAWATLALAKEGEGGDAAARGVQWLLREERASAAEDTLQLNREVLQIDARLRGWPWLPGEATWVEPTALAVLALKEGPASSESRDRIDEASRYLADRRCRGGGWNVGNPVMFSQDLPARACPTAWALLALAAAASDQVRREDLEALRSDMHADGGALALGWGLVTLRALGEDDGVAAARLAALQLADGSWNGNPYHTAIALMAARGSL